MCDHYTRARAGGSKQLHTSPVLGILLGSRSGAVTTVVDATDIVFECDSRGDVSINKPELVKKISLWTSMGHDKTTSLLGWYAFGAAAAAWHVSLHRTVRSVSRRRCF